MCKNPDPATMSVTDLAKLLGFGVPATRKLIQSGRGPGYYLEPGPGQRDGVYVIPRRAVDRWLAGEPGMWTPGAGKAYGEALAEQDRRPASPFIRRIAS